MEWEKIKTTADRSIRLLWFFYRVLDREGGGTTPRGISGVG
jgi:hypothetical protein